MIEKELESPLILGQMQKRRKSTERVRQDYFCR